MVGSGLAYLPVKVLVSRFFDIHIFEPLLGLNAKIVGIYEGR